jgi:hypothetical protein
MELDPSIEIAPGELARKLEMSEQELRQALDEAATAKDPDGRGKSPA